MIGCLEGIILTIATKTPKIKPTMVAPIDISKVFASPVKTRVIYSLDVNMFASVSKKPALKLNSIKILC